MSMEHLIAILSSGIIATHRTLVMITTYQPAAVDSNRTVIQKAGSLLAACFL